MDILLFKSLPLVIYSDWNPVLESRPGIPVKNTFYGLLTFTLGFYLNMMSFYFKFIVWRSSTFVTSIWIHDCKDYMVFLRIGIDFSKFLFGLAHPSEVFIALGGIVRFIMLNRCWLYWGSLFWWLIRFDDLPRVKTLALSILRVLCLLAKSCIEVY